VVRLGRHYEALGLRERAIELYLRSLDADEMAEPFYQGLMRCHAALGQDAEALAVYHRLSRTFAVTAGLKPSPVTEALRAQLSGMTIPAR
jgi:DNA-binding SARP family transcriptional activator